MKVVRVQTCRHRGEDLRTGDRTWSSRLRSVLPTSNVLTASNSRFPPPWQLRGRRPAGASAGYRSRAASSTHAHCGKSWQGVKGRANGARIWSTSRATLVRASRPELSVASWSSPRTDSTTSFLWIIPEELESRGEGGKGEI